jgi:two-component system, OmpR family, sensor histidine kinase KdpD
MDAKRPDPDRLLAGLKEEAARAARGRFKVFLGATAGVGKTYAMLEQARVRQRQGADVVVGWVETHGRRETEALLEGLEILPALPCDYRGARLLEFDLDGALARRPQLLLLDELAHSNAPGTRHVKRWQDAEELLDAGIDVFTAINIQHVESLNDVVSQTTGVVVRETVPDRVLEAADEIELVDITPEDLLRRLQEGKVYFPAQAERAMRGFFTRGNLIALRELALRKAAERVDADLRTFKQEKGIARVLPVAERLLVCLSAGSTAPRVVRAAARLAAGLRAEWIVAHVERPGDPRPGRAGDDLMARTLGLAEKLGAETVTLTGNDIGGELLEFARNRNVSRIVVGKPTRPWWRSRLFGSVVDDLVRRSDEMDVYVIRGEAGEAPPAPFPRLRRHSRGRDYLLSGVSVAATAGFCALLQRQLATSNLAMVFLLDVVWVAALLGRGPSILASILGVAVFDFFFVPPFMTLAVSDGEYLITFGVMLGVALLISTLTVRLKEQAQAYRRREQRTAALYRMSREMARSGSLADVVASVERHFGEVFDSEVWVLLADGAGRLTHAPGVTSAFPLDPKEQAVAEWVNAHGQLAGRGTDTLGAARALYVPLKTGRGTVGVVGLFPAGEGSELSAEHLDYLEGFASQTAVVIERALLADEARQARLRIEAERLRSLLLSSVSHDLRTPLSAITGAASSLLEGEGALGDDTRRELTQSILDESERLNRLLGNLLTMTRIESGAVRVRKEWQPLEEVVGAALNHVEKGLRRHPVTINLPENLPLVPIDGVLIEQVLMNLLENALKYTPEDATIEITARSEAGGVVVEVADRGHGLPEGDEARVFEKFYRGPHARDRRGVGLGLPICRGILEAHGGRIWAGNRPGGGAFFRFQLPAEGTPPEVEPEEDEE